MIRILTILIFVFPLTAAAHDDEPKAVIGEEPLVVQKLHPAMERARRECNPNVLGGVTVIQNGQCFQFYDPVCATPILESAGFEVVGSFCPVRRVGDSSAALLKVIDEHWLN